MNVSNQQLKRYAEALAMWQRRFNTAEIAAHIGVDEPIVHRWIVHYRELMLGHAA